jgi:hypothetical protein
MSARNKLHARLFKGPDENRDDLIDAYRAEILHEAAEKLRGLIGRTDYPGESDWVTRYVEGWRDAARQLDRGVAKQ